MSKVLFLLIAVLLCSCRASNLFGHKPSPSRGIAARPMNNIIADDIDTRLHSLHQYYLIGQKNLELYDQQIREGDVEKLYEGQPYLKLLAVRSQVEDIEHEIMDIWQELDKDHSKKSNLKKIMLMQRILRYAQKTPMSSLSMENLIEKLQLQGHNFFKSIPITKKAKKMSSKDLAKEYAEFSAQKEFDIYEKNIEHLSHLIDMKMEAFEEKKFYPSSTRAGNITGNEFPAKVWALTFDDGPGKATSQIILKNLKERGLRATFFQLTKLVHTYPSIADEIRDAGMEIASHSYTHKQLTKASQAELEREITTAVNELKKAHDINIKFFRLPYGAGVSTAHIRQKIADNHLIHVFWNIDTLDWMAQPPEKIVARTIALMKKTSKDAGVLLFHDIHQRTAEATPQIMDYLKKDNRRVCTLDEIVTQMNEGVAKVCPQK